MQRPASLTTHDGLNVLLTAVTADVDEGHVEIFLEIESGPAARAALSKHRADMEAWIAVKGEDGRPIGSPPPQPAGFLLSLPISLADDRGTQYRWRSGQAGGSGTELQGRWRWVPAPPALAGRLVIDVAGGSRLTLRRTSAQGWDLAQP